MTYIATVTPSGCTQDEARPAILGYIAVDAGHALAKWETQLGDRTLDWASMANGDRQRYRDSVEIAASQFSLVTISEQELMASGGNDHERLIELADEVL